MGRIALIPARGGSKGVTRKNLQVVGGRTLINLAFDSAEKSGEFEEIWVSSEDREILEHATSLGALIHPRSDLAAVDSSTASDVVLDFLNFEQKYDDTSICYLQPTSPMRTERHVSQAIELHSSTKLSPIIGVKRAKELPEKMLTLTEMGLLTSYNSANTSNINRQKAPQYLYPNGAIYVFTIKDFRREGGFPISGAIPFIMNELESLDIDSREDLWLARRIWS